jgi:uncharacterized protein YndB with AHSA1/START domain
MPDSAAATSRSDEGEVVLTVTRLFDATPERVFDAWLDPAAFGRWLFATPGGRMERCELDPRRGGRFSIVERRGDTLAAHHGTYLEIDRPRRLSFTFADSFAATPTLVVVDFAPAEPSGGCRVTLTHRLDPVWTAHLPSARRGWTGILDGLADTVSGERELVITRDFDAPRALVFRAWTDPAHAARWYGPRGFTATHMVAELRPGGAWRSCIRRDSDGMEMWQGGVYQEVLPPERLSFTFAWDREGGTRSPETLVTISFDELEGGRRTRMVFRQAVFESVGARDGHRGGWSSAFERLAETVEAAAYGETAP